MCGRGLFVGASGLTSTMWVRTMGLRRCAVAGLLQDIGQGDGTAANLQGDLGEGRGALVDLQGVKAEKGAV